ncbi:MAG: UbiA family prenyltransferase [Planctomycetes bacterium]|nr:UbiA family prenyltransferase [Planctomycetota bacterium]
MSSALLPWLRLLRVGTLFSPAADVVAGLAIAGLPWSSDALRACLASVALYAAGMVLNDHADRRVDAVQRPERPIPSGRIRAAHALGLGVALLATALLLSPLWPLHAAMGLLVLAYDYANKRSAAFGVLALGLLRGTNLLSGVVAVSGSLPDDMALRTAALAYAAYIAAVTVLGIFEDEPRVAARAVRAVQTLPPGAALFAILSIEGRALGNPGLATLIAALLALAFLLRLRDRTRVWDRGAIRASMTWLLLGTMLYTALLCLAVGRPVEALAIAVAAFLARAISRRIALT